MTKWLMVAGLVLFLAVIAYLLYRPRPQVYSWKLPMVRQGINDIDYVPEDYK